MSLQTYIYMLSIYSSIDKWHHIEMAHLSKVSHWNIIFFFLLQLTSTYAASEDIFFTQIGLKKTVLSSPIIASSAREGG